MQHFPLDVLKGKQLFCKEPLILHITQVALIEDVKKNSFLFLEFFWLKRLAVLSYSFLESQGLAATTFLNKNNQVAE